MFGFYRRIRSGEYVPAWGYRRVIPVKVAPDVDVTLELVACQTAEGWNIYEIPTGRCLICGYKLRRGAWAALSSRVLISAAVIAKSPMYQKWVAELEAYKKSKEEKV